MANQIINLNSVTPATPSGKGTVYFQSDYGTPIANTSAYIDLAPAFVYTGILSGIPATATVGQLAFVTNAPAGQNIYVATAPNVWTQTGGTSAYVYTGVLSGIPATATVGQLAFITNATPGQNVYVATAPNTWTQSSSPAGGANTDVQFNDSGVLGGNAGFVYNKTTFAVNIQGDETLSKQIAATSGANQNSPSLVLAGTYWDGAASQISSFTITRTVAAGTNPNMNTNFINAGYGGGGGFYFNSTVNANTITSASSITASTDVIIQETGPATSITNYNSGLLYIKGQYWNGAATAYDTWSIQDVLGTGTNPTSTLVFSHSGSPGAAGIVATGIPFTIGNLITSAIFMGGPIEFTAAAATGSGNVSSYPLIFDSSYWDGAAAQLDQWTQHVVLGTGTNPTSTLTFSHAGTPGLASVDITAPLIANTLTVTAATPTGAAGTVSLGTTTATSATAGGNGDVPAQVVGYLTIDIAGTKYQIPYYAV